jgi:hypothetical protein
MDGVFQLVEDALRKRGFTTPSTRGARLESVLGPTIYNTLCVAKSRARKRPGFCLALPTLQKIADSLGYDLVIQFVDKKNV